MPGLMNTPMAIEGISKARGIPKEELIHAVWPDTFVTDQVLTTAIYQLRQAFGEDAKSSRLIQTIPKGGYRLTAKVIPASADTSEAHLVTPAAAPRPRGRRWAVAYVLPVLVHAEPLTTVRGQEPRVPHPAREAVHGVPLAHRPRHGDGRQHDEDGEDDRRDPVAEPRGDPDEGAHRGLGRRTCSARDAAT